MFIDYFCLFYNAKIVFLSVEKKKLRYFSPLSRRFSLILLFLRMSLTFFYSWFCFLHEHYKIHGEHKKIGGLQS